VRGRSATSVTRVREIARVGLAGVGSVIGALLLGSVWGTVPGALFGLLAAFLGEWVLEHHAELKRLQKVEKTVQQEITRRELAERQAKVSARGMAVAEAWTEVFGGAVSEAIRAGRVLPVDAILARAEMTMKARGLATPPSEPDEWPGNPPFSSGS